MLSLLLHAGPVLLIDPSVLESTLKHFGSKSKIKPAHENAMRILHAVPDFV